MDLFDDLDDEPIGEKDRLHMGWHDEKGRLHMGPIDEAC